MAKRPMSKKPVRELTDEYLAYVADDIVHACFDHVDQNDPHNSNDRAFCIKYVEKKLRAVADRAIDK